jgi:hypothetical protein
MLYSKDGRNMASNLQSTANTRRKKKKKKSFLQKTYFSKFVEIISAQIHISCIVLNRRHLARKHNEYYYPKVLPQSGEEVCKNTNTTDSDEKNTKSG